MKKLMVLGMLMVGAVAQADDWQHASLRSTEGVSIQFDYQKRHIEDGNANSHGELAPFWINVHGLRPSDHVTARVMNFDTRRNHWVENRDITLRFEGGRFTGQFDGFPFYRFTCGAPIFYAGKWTCQRGSDTLYEYRQELNVQVNGVYLTDPMNGSHNFKIDL